ncbi:MAG: peptidylprolyl isomerase [Chloroflexota bacterium]
MLTVTDDVVVSMEYTLRVDGGDVVDSSEGRPPFQFIQGRGEIVPGLERQLYGLTVGDAREVVVEAAEGYGEFDSDLFETLPRSAFAPDVELEAGMAFRVQTDDGQAAIAYVDQMDDDEVTLNLNHPLAGERLTFSIKIADVREAIPEDLAGCGCGCGSCGGACDCEDDEGGCGGEDNCACQGGCKH